MFQLIALRNAIRAIKGFVASKQWLSAVNAIADLMQEMGLPDADKFKSLIQGISEENARAIAVSGMSLLADALSAYFKFPPINVSALPGGFVQATPETALADKLDRLDACLEQADSPTVETPLGTPTGATDTPTVGMDPAIWLALFQMIPSILKLIQDRRNRRPA